MKKEKTFKIGDKIIYFSQVYRIFKIKKGKENEDKVIFFKSYFKNQENRKLVFSVPINSINKKRVRRPLSKKKLKDLLKTKSQKPEAVKIAINTVKIRELLGSNDLDKNVEVLKQLWQEKKDNPGRFSKSKESVFKLAIKRLSEEVAFVNNISLIKAKEKIRSSLEKEGI